MCTKKTCIAKQIVSVIAKQIVSVLHVSGPTNVATTKLMQEEICKTSSLGHVGHAAALNYLPSLRSGCLPS